MVQQEKQSDSRSSDYVHYLEGSMRKREKVLYYMLIAIALICYIYFYTSAEAAPGQAINTAKSLTP